MLTGIMETQKRLDFGGRLGLLVAVLLRGTSNDGEGLAGHVLIEGGCRRIFLLREVPIAAQV
jgi:hypothetical protein